MLKRVFEITGLEPFFDAVVTADDVAREKPAPDGYLRALALLGAHATDAVVVEDTEAGVAAGLVEGVTAQTTSSKAHSSESSRGGNTSGEPRTHSPTHARQWSAS